MARETSRSGTSRAEVLMRRGVFGRRGARSERIADAVFRAPAAWWALVIWGVFIIVCGSLATWARQRPMVAVGRVMNSTALARLAFTVEDMAQTERLREQARRQAVRVYRLVPGVVDAIRASIENLPKTLENAQSIEQVIPEVRTQFRLNEEGLAAIRSQVHDGEVSQAWRQKTQNLVEALPRQPLLDERTYQLESQEGFAPEVLLRGADASKESEQTVRQSQLVSITNDRQLK
jgi:membrane-associated HD superfamily phosphohydrolase